MRRLPPLVAPSEVDALRAQLAEVAEGKRFLLQGGDCAERFVDCASEPIEAKLRILLQMSLVLTWGARIPTLRIARMAGQFSKPRSKDTETLADGSEVTAFRGDNVNSFDLSARTPDPSRIVSGYFHSAATLNYARTLLSAGESRACYPAAGAATVLSCSGSSGASFRPIHFCSPHGAMHFLLVFLCLNLSPQLQALPTCTRPATGTWASCRTRRTGGSTR